MGIDDSILHWWTGIFVQQILGKVFWVVWAPFRLSSETNDISAESPYKILLESGVWTGKAPSTVWQNWFEWKSTTFSRWEISPFSAQILLILFVLSFGIALGFLKRYVTPC